MQNLDDRPWYVGYDVFTGEFNVVAYREGAPMIVHHKKQQEEARRIVKSVNEAKKKRIAF